MLVSLPSEYVGTRDVLHRVAAHVMARRRHQLTGKIGLRATPGGFGTPAAGPEHETIRVRGAYLIRERTGQTSLVTQIDLEAATMRHAAAFAEVDLDEPFAAGPTTPPLGDPDERLGIDVRSVEALATWFEFAWLLLDELLPQLAVDAEPTVAQLWPEHFDAALDLAVSGRRVNVGASPGDRFSAQPYVYVGPWGPERPGDVEYWNAPFGAMLTYEHLVRSDDPIAAALSFVQRGLAELQATVPSAP